MELKNKTLWMKRSAWILCIFLMTWYAYYAGKVNTNHWWKEQPPLRHALIVRPEPSQKIVEEPCSVVVDRNSVLTILPNGTTSANTTNAGVRNCQFQWVEVR